MHIKTGMRKTAGLVSVITAAAALGALAAPAHAASSTSVCTSRIKTADALNSKAVAADEPRADPDVAASYNVKTQKGITGALSECRSAHDPKTVKARLDSAAQDARRAELANRSQKVNEARDAQLQVKDALRKALSAA